MTFLYFFVALEGFLVQHQEFVAKSSNQESSQNIVSERPPKCVPQIFCILAATLYVDYLLGLNCISGRLTST